MNHTKNHKHALTWNKFLITLLSIVTAAFLIPVFSSCNFSSEKCKIEIVLPTYYTIAPDRSFYITGSLSGEVPDNATLKAELKDEKGQVVRCVSTDIKSNHNIDAFNADLVYLDSSDIKREKLYHFAMPEIVLDKDGHINNGDIKASYNDNSFSVLIPNAFIDIPGTDFKPELEFVDSNGNPYSSLPQGKYQINLSLSKNNETLGLTIKDIEIKHSENKILNKWDPQNHFDKVKKFAKDNNYAIFTDWMSGAWAPDTKNAISVFYREGRLGDLAEYVEGLTHAILYNITEDSNSWSVELGYMQWMSYINNPNHLKYYYYDIGEPSIHVDNENKDIEGNFTEFPNNKKMILTRADISSNIEQENSMASPDVSIENVDTNFSDGVEIKGDKKLYINGVVLPIQNKREEISTNQQTVQFFPKNKISKITYKITGDNINDCLSKDIFLDRKINGEDFRSLLEFRSNIDIKPEYQNKYLNIEVSCQDIYGNIVEGTQDSFTLHVLP